jgi:hypothetical protein
MSQGMKAFCAAVLLASAAAVGGTGAVYCLDQFYLHPPSPSSGNSQGEHEGAPTEKHHESNDDQATPKNRAPFVVRNDDPKDDNSATAKTKNEGDRYSNPDWWIAGFTGLLVLVTALLWIFTALLWRSTRSAVRDGSEALKLAEKEFVSAHRPRLILREAISLIGDPESGTIHVNYTIANVGGTRCWITDCRIGIELVPEIGYPHFLATPDMSFPNNVPYIGAIVPGQRKTLAFSDPLQRWDANHRKDYAAPAGVHLVGRIIYIDEAGSNIKRHTAFRWRYDRQTQRFHRIWDKENEHEYAD